MTIYCTNYFVIIVIIRIWMCYFALQTLDFDRWYNCPHTIHYAFVGHCRGIYVYYMIILIACTFLSLIV